MIRNILLKIKRCIGNSLVLFAILRSDIINKINNILFIIIVVTGYIIKNLLESLNYLTLIDSFPPSPVSCGRDVGSGHLPLSLDTVQYPAVGTLGGDGMGLWDLSTPMLLVLVILYFFFLALLFFISTDILRNLLVYSIANDNRRLKSVVLLGTLIYLLKNYYISIQLETVLIMITPKFGICDIFIILFTLCLIFSLYRIKNLNLKEFIKEKFYPSTASAGPLKLSFKSILINILIVVFSLVFLHFIIVFLLKVEFAAFIGFLLPLFQTVYCDDGDSIHTVTETETTGLHSLAYYTNQEVPTSISRNHDINHLRSLLIRIDDFQTGEEGLKSYEFSKTKRLPPAHPLFLMVESLLGVLMAFKGNLNDDLLRSMSNLHREILILLNLYSREDIPREARLNFSYFLDFSLKLTANDFAESEEGFIRENYMYDRHYPYPANHPYYIIKIHDLYVRDPRILSLVRKQIMEGIPEDEEYATALMYIDEYKKRMDKK